jgi:hypothetical protein
MPKGGPRKGSGRPKGRKNTFPEVKKGARLDAQALYRQRVEKELQPLLAATMKAAKAGNVQMLRDVWDRFIGKPIERLEHSGGMTHRIFRLPEGTAVDLGNAQPCLPPVRK